MKKVMRFIRFRIFRNILKYFRSVRVYDNYVGNIKPALFFRNKIRYSLKQWIPIGADSPFGRLTYIKGHAVECGSPIVKFCKLSDMGKNFTKNGKDYIWTHWQDAP